MPSIATRDLPTGVVSAFTDWIPRARKEITIFTKPEATYDEEAEEEAEIVRNQIGDLRADVKDRTSVKSLWPIFTAGAGLFSDGYTNNAISTASTCLSTIYGKQYTESNAISNVSAIAFVGIVVGQLSFGIVSDYVSRKAGMLISSGMLIFFSILCAGAWGVNTTAYGNAGGLFAALTAYRFFLGIGIGAEYPSGSAACAEAASLLPAGKRNRYFALFTDAMIDLGFVISSFVPMVMLWICGPDHLQPVWRVTLGIGAIFPISLFIMRLFYKEDDTFSKLNFKKTRIPYWLVIKFYWFRLTIVALIWFIYDFSSYSFGIYSTPIIESIIPDGDLYKTFGWNVVLNLFYMPGAILGALAADYIGPRLTLVIGVTLQAVVGYIMAGCYSTLKSEIGGFVVVYGIFLTLGEFGPGDNIGLLAAKTSATPIRGQYYAIAAAVGKIGGFVGTYIFPIIIKNHGGSSSVTGMQYPFWVSSTLCVFSAILALFFLPPVDQDAIMDEDVRFLNYLAESGFDISLIGDNDHPAVMNMNHVESSSLEEDKSVGKETVKVVE